MDWKQEEYENLHDQAKSGIQEAARRLLEMEQALKANSLKANKPGADPGAREADIWYQIEVLDKAAEQLMRQVSMLEERLDAILIPRINEDSQEKPEEARTSLGRRIQQGCLLVESSANRLSILMRNLEI